MGAEGGREQKKRESEGIFSSAYTDTGPIVSASTP